MDKKTRTILALALAGASHTAVAEEVIFNFGLTPTIEGTSVNFGSALLGETFLYEVNGLEVRVDSRGAYSSGNPNYVSFLSQGLGIGVHSLHNAQFVSETPFFENFTNGSSNNLTLEFSVPVRLDALSLGYIGSDSDLQVRYAAGAGVGRTDVTSNLPMGSTSVNQQGVYSTRWIIDPVPLNWNTGGLYPTTDGLVESVLINGITVDADLLPQPPSGDAPTLSELAHDIPENNYPAAFLDWSDPNGDTVSAEIIGGEDAGLFDYYEDDQKLVFLAAPDFENPHDFDRNNRYEVIMSATDGTNTAEFPVTIEATEVNEPPEQSCCIVWNLSLGDSIVGEIISVDPENDPVTLSIVDGLDSALFQISDAGVLSLLVPSNVETSYSLTVMLSDGTNDVFETLYVNVIQE